jgi:hypothetical protein
MGIMDKLTAGAERAAKEAEKAFEKGKTKVGELQIEMQMDGLAKKLGYLVFDFYRGREVDQAVRQRILDDLSRLEDQLLQARAEAAARAQGAAPGAAPTPGPGAAGAGAGPEDEAAHWPADAAGDNGADPLQDDDVAPPAAS